MNNHETSYEPQPRKYSMIRPLLICIMTFTACFGADPGADRLIIDRLAAGETVPGITAQSLKTIANGQVEDGKVVSITDEASFVLTESYVTADGKPTGIGKCIVRNAGTSTFQLDPSRFMIPKDKALALAAQGGTPIIEIRPLAALTLKPGDKATLWVQSMVPINDPKPSVASDDDAMVVALMKSLVKGSPETGIAVRSPEQAPLVRFRYKSAAGWSDAPAPASLSAAAYVDDGRGHLAITYRLTWEGDEVQIAPPYLQTRGLLAIHTDLPTAGSHAVKRGDVLTFHAVLDGTHIRAIAGFWLHASDPDGKPMDLWMFPAIEKP